MKRREIHPSITDTKVIESVSADDESGCCLACGTEDPGPMEPDARQSKCEECGRYYVFPWQEILLRGYYHQTTEA